MAFKSIKTRELPCWIKVFKNSNTEDKEEILSDLNLIDDLLTLQKTQSLLNRKKNLKHQLDGRIGLEVGHRRFDLNRK